MIAPFLPMLAVRGTPQDAPEYLYEVKWNGVRALAGSGAGGWRLWGRGLAEYDARYPELAFLSRLPAGTVLDGEVVLLRDGVPDLDAVLARHHVTNPQALRYRSTCDPVTYVVFDAPYAGGRCLFGQPLQARRARLRDLVAQVGEPRLVFSEGVVGAGRALFAQAVGQGHEGVMAKHLASGYVPGRRSAAWQKLKPVRSLPCVLVGVLPGRPGFRGLLVAAPVQGQLRYVATLHGGVPEPVLAQVQALVARRGRPRPVVACPRGAVGVEPELYCQVGYLDWTGGGRLRGARFQGLLEDPASPAGTPPAPGANR
jgi:ATP-dependent DNA ligase